MWKVCNLNCRLIGLQRTIDSGSGRTASPLGSRSRNELNATLLLTAEVLRWWGAEVLSVVKGRSREDRQWCRRRRRRGRSQWFPLIIRWRDVYDSYSTRLIHGTSTNTQSDDALVRQVRNYIHTAPRVTSYDSHRPLRISRVNCRPSPSRNVHRSIVPPIFSKVHREKRSRLFFTYQ